MTGKAFYHRIFNNAGVMILHAEMSSNSQVTLTMQKTFSPSYPYLWAPRAHHQRPSAPQQTAPPGSAPEHGHAAFPTDPHVALRPAAWPASVRAAT